MKNFFGGLLLTFVTVAALSVGASQAHAMANSLTMPMVYYGTSGAPSAAMPRYSDDGRRSGGLDTVDTHGEVSLLQTILFHRYHADIGGESGDFITGFFGPLTDTYLKKFQCAAISLCSDANGNATNASNWSDSSGFGWTGPRTRAALNGYAALNNLLQASPSTISFVSPVAGDTVTAGIYSLARWTFGSGPCT